MPHSAWFWNTPYWRDYQADYDASRPHTWPTYKSSPLANDHDFSDLPADYQVTEHRTQVVDLTQTDRQLWQGVRDSYHSIVARARETYAITECEPYHIFDYQKVHAEANGRQPRSNITYVHQRTWLADGLGLLVGAKDQTGWKAFSYWITYKGAAYYMSGPSIERSVQHGVIWASLLLLKGQGITLAELGQLDGATEKERNIGRFKAGWGGEARPFLIAKKQED